MTKKIVFVVSTLDSGGVENYLLRFLRFFNSKIQPIVICRGNYLGELEEEYRKISQIEIVKMDLAKFNFNSNTSLYLFLKDSKADAIVDFSGHFSGIVLFIAKLAGIKRRIVFYRESTYQFELNFFKTLYINFSKTLVNSFSTKILSNSFAALDFFHATRNKNSQKYSVIYNGIDFQIGDKKFLKEDFGIPENGFVIGHTGRYNFAKNHGTIIKVAEKICKKYNDIYFVMCGKNTDVELLETVSKNKVLKDKVKLLGYRDDVNSILPIFDLFIFPSITEGQPNSLIEAMVAGLPIVASNINTILETTPLELHKDLIDPLDFSAFADAIEKYYLGELKSNSGLSEWAEKKFSAKILFQEFFDEL